MSSPIATKTVTYDVQDAAIGPLLTDDSGQSAPTYGPWLDVPGIQQVQVNPQFVTAQLKGDAVVLDNRGKTASFDITANYALLDIEVIAALLGGTVVNTGGSVATWELDGNDASTPYVRFAFTILDVSTGLGSVITCLNKANLTGGNLFDQQTDQYGARSLQLSAITPLASGKMIKTTISKTASSIQTLMPVT